MAGRKKGAKLSMKPAAVKAREWREQKRHEEKAVTRAPRKRMVAENAPRKAQNGRAVSIGFAVSIDMTNVKESVRALVASAAKATNESGIECVLNCIYHLQSELNTISEDLRQGHNVLSSNRPATDKAIEGESNGGGDTVHVSETKAKNDWDKAKSESLAMPEENFALYEAEGSSPA